MGCGKHFWTSKKAKTPKWEEATKAVVKRTGSGMSTGMNNAGTGRECFCKQRDKCIIYHSSHVASSSPFHPGISRQGTVT